jgi:hypothetical protein
MRAALLAAAMLAVAAPAQAGFVNGRSGWADLSPTAKTGYAMAAFDSLIMLPMATDKAMTAVAISRERCALDANLESDDIVALIEKGYEDVQNWKFSPAAVLGNQLVKMCRPYLDQERKRLGLPPL